MPSYRNPLMGRALATAGVLALAATTVLGGPASADHPAPDSADHSAPAGEECRSWAPHPHPFLKIAAAEDRFDTSCLEAPANRRFRIYLENHDTDDHNLSIYTADPDQDSKAGLVFKGEKVKGRGARSGMPTALDYRVGALSPGEYFFRDDNVKGMSGVLVVPGED